MLNRTKAAKGDIILFLGNFGRHRYIIEIITGSRDVFGASPQHPMTRNARVVLFIGTTSTTRSLLPACLVMYVTVVVTDM